jgi:hypothetical protein
LPICVRALMAGSSRVATEGDVPGKRFLRPRTEGDGPGKRFLRVRTKGDGPGKRFLRVRTKGDGLRKRFLRVRTKGDVLGKRFPGARTAGDVLGKRFLRARTAGDVLGKRFLRVRTAGDVLGKRLEPESTVFCDSNVGNIEAIVVVARGLLYSSAQLREGATEQESNGICVGGEAVSAGARRPAAARCTRERASQRARSGGAGASQRRKASCFANAPTAPPVFPSMWLEISSTAR